MGNSSSKMARVPALEPRVPGLELAIELAADHGNQPIPAIQPPAAVEVLDFALLDPDVEPPPPPEVELPGEELVMLVVDGSDPPLARYITKNELKKINLRLAGAREFAAVMQGIYMPQHTSLDANGIHHIGLADMDVVDRLTLVEENFAEAIEHIAEHLRGQSIA